MSDEMASVLELPKDIQGLIQSEFERTSKQHEHQFEELAKYILKSNAEFEGHPAELFAAVNALLQDRPRAGGDIGTEDARLLNIIKMENNEQRRRLTEILVAKLWNTHEHPPLSHVGNKHQYRQADGSHNNVIFPDLGKAGSPYAKAVISKTMMPGNRPDPGLIFDSLMARGNSFTPHPSGFSSMFFVHAAIITHDIFHTDRTDFSINNASSYLDLSPLYGSSQTEQDWVRTFKDGRLKPDTFSDKRVLGLPPAVCVMLIMYNRFHNYVAESLASINEGGRFTASSDTVEAKKKRDNDLFQVARLVTNGLYANISVNDYIRAIFDVNKTNSDWTLDPQAPIKIPIELEAPGSTVPIGAPTTAPERTELPRGVGSHVSCEFNLLYRFHSALSRGDAQWTEEFFDSIFPNQDVSKLSLREFLLGIGKFEKGIDVDPSKRCFAGLERKNGKFDDGSLVRILKEAIEEQAGAFGVNCVPDVLRNVEILGIMQARNWQVASLNELRVSLGLTAYDRFESFNPDLRVAETLRTLYGHPDNVEMYPGLFLEDFGPGTAPRPGISAPPTVTGAILADAVSLIRGDRHLTLDYTPAALTNWGIREVAPDRETLGGSKMHHLILNAFPRWFKFNSVYAMQPFYTRTESDRILTNLGVRDLYSFDAPALQSQIIPITSHAAVRRVLEDTGNFKVPWAESGFLLNFMLTLDGPEHNRQQTLVRQAWSLGTGSVQKFTDFAKLISVSALKSAATPLRLGGRSVYQVDVVKDFGNLVAIQFTSVMCKLPLKSEFNPTGTYEADKLYNVIINLVEYILITVDPTKEWALRRNVTTSIEALTKTLKEQIWELKQSSTPADSTTSISTFGADFTSQLLCAGTSIDETVDILLGSAVGILGTTGTIFGQFIDFYLRTENQRHWNQIVQLSIANNTASDKILEKFILESARLCGPLGLPRDVDPADGNPIELTVDQAGRKILLKKGDRVVTSFLHAGQDPTVFPEPMEVKLDRPIRDYLSFGLGRHECLGRRIGINLLCTMVKTVAVLKNLRRAPGDQGYLRQVQRPGRIPQFMTLDWSELTPYATTLKLLFDKCDF